MNGVDGDRRLEAGIGRVLRLCVLTSSALLLSGLLLDLAHHPFGSRLMSLGVLILIGTPAARVVFSFVEFLLKRDIMFIVMTGLVVIEIGAGIVAAVVFHRRL
jgi:uncharacterized membrane protein